MANELQKKKLLPLAREDYFGDEFWKALDRTLIEGFGNRKQKFELPPELLEPVITRPVSGVDLEYLQQLHAYLVIQNGESENHIQPSGKATLIRSESGWVIHDYGNVVMASAGYHSFGAHPEAFSIKAINDLMDEDEGGRGGRGRRIPARQRAKQLKETGTIVRQIVTTTQDMLGLIQKRWPSLKITEGFASMQRMAWVIATINNYPVVGFEASVPDRVVLEWAKRNGADKLKIRELLAQRAGAGKTNRPTR